MTNPDLRPVDLDWFDERIEANAQRPSLAGWEALARDLRAALNAPPRKLPSHTRLILASENILEQWGTRTEDGRRITVEWGDRQPGGWYEPIFTVHEDREDPTPPHPGSDREGEPG